MLQDSLGVDGEPGYKETCKDSIDSARETEGTSSVLLIYTKIESTNNNTTAGDGREARLVFQNKVYQKDVEGRCKASSDVIEGDVNMLETEVVESDHSNKYDGQW